MMNKFRSLTTGARVMAAGALLFFVGLVLSFVVNMSAYSKLSSCLNGQICTWKWEIVAGYISSGLIFVGCAIFIIGFAFLFFAPNKPKQKS